MSSSQPRKLSLTSIANGKSVRADATAPLGEPRTLTFSHAQVTRSAGVADRHLVRFDETISGVSPNPDVVPSVQLVIEAPRDTVTVAQIKDVLARLVTFLGVGANIDKLLNGEP